MSRGTQYVKIKLDYLNTVLRPNATVVVSRKFADILELEAEEVFFKEGREGERTNEAICRNAKEPDLEIKSNIDIEE